MNKTNIAELERFIIEQNKALHAENERSKKAVAGMKWEITNARTMINQQLAGLDQEKILHAEHIIKIGGKYENAGEDRALCVDRAIRELIDGGKYLFGYYVGTKNYDRWSGQFTSHAYGMGPSHGSICFSIELTRAVRNHREEKKLTEEEIESAVYYLRNLVAIQKAATAAKVECAQA